MSDDSLSLDEAVQHIMKAKNCSARSARRQLMNALRSGKIPATGISSETLRREQVPTTFFRGESFDA